MMRIINNIGLVFMIFIMSACGDEFLDRKPLGQLTSESFFKTETHAIQAVNAVYANFRSWEFCGLPYIGATDVISDDSDKGSSENDGLFLKEIDDFLFDATNQTFSTIWLGHYNSISRANQAIINIPVIDMNEGLKNRLVGEAKFIRAFCYFRLVQWFGEVPLVDKQLADNEYFTQTQSSVQEIYDFVEKDLKDAIASLPEKSEYASADLGRATKGAAKGILAKLYLLEKKNAEALALCEEIINSNQYQLIPQYNLIFTEANENGTESVFEIGAVALQAAVAGPGATPFNMVQGVRGIPNLGWGFNRPSDNLVAAYEPGDPRRQATVIYVGEILPDGVTQVQDNPDIFNERFNQKAWVPAHAGLQDNGPGNIRILRYADVLLLAAEAANEVGNSAKALEYVNQVRKRARGSNNFILKDLTITNQSDLRTAIRKERRVELALEQHRWFDLKRWGIQSEVFTKLGKNFITGKHELFPLPQTEIDLTTGNLKQNPGY
ncbi:MAG TPA: RagB/SusD family nutrient uptake outer membrane protein [Saprospiraceae bacterium]|nr:RagB/SusD family nutrient uptake outer membrane protein [Saprospiraceae bacterium]